jgi:hypothetical protein
MGPSSLPHFHEKAIALLTFEVEVESHGWLNVDEISKKG